MNADSQLGNVGDWRGLSQLDLDRAYDQSQHAANMLDVLAQCADLSQLTRAGLGQLGITLERLHYGTDADEALDWYRKVGSPKSSGLLFFIHGGAWRSGRAQDYGFFVDWMTAAGLDVVVPDFSAAVHTNGRLEPIVDQLVRAWLYSSDRYRTNDEQSRPMYLCGHSSGAHLAACLLLEQGESRVPKISASVDGLVLCSGLFDLEPVGRSSRNSYLNLSLSTLENLSPIRHVSAFDLPVQLLCGTSESPEFRRQSAEFHAALVDVGVKASLAWGGDLNHFEILKSLSSEDGFFSQHVKRMMLEPR